MLVLGDVVAFVAILLGFAAAAWGGMLLSALVFPGPAYRSAQWLSHRPWASFWSGLAFGIPAVLIGVVLLSLPDPTVKLLGFVWLMGVVFMGMVGSGGLAIVAGDKVMEAGGAPNRFAALAKGGGLAVASCLMPVFGWFFLAPVMLVATLGACVLGLVRKSPAAAKAQTQ